MVTYVSQKQFDKLTAPWREELNMTQMKIDIPLDLLDEAAGKELESARRKIKKLEKENLELKSRELEAKKACEAFRSARSFFADQFDLYEDYGF